MVDEKRKNSRFKSFRRFSNSRKGGSNENDSIGLQMNKKGVRGGKLGKEPVMQVGNELLKGPETRSMEVIP